MISIRLSLAIAGLLSLSMSSHAADLDPSSLKNLSIETGNARGFPLAGSDASRQLVVTATTPEGRDIDATRMATYTVEPADVANVDETGFVTPRMDGSATITATVGPHSAKTSVTVTRFVEDVPVHFVNQVVPTFTKFACNSGGCHGKADGQNGFKLSLLGFEPQEDFEFLVKEARGRRLFASSPENSLLLRKAIGVAPHGGGKKLESDSPFYRILLRWIRQGAPYGQADGGAVAKIEVFPRERLLGRNGQQQLLVLARHADGSTTDVTRMAQFESNETNLATVNSNGLVAAKQIPGTAAIMVRYQSHVDVFRATVPLGVKVVNLPESDSYIDKLVFDRLTQLGIPPSALSDDASFLRRVTLDIAGRLPTKSEVESFIAESAKDKREKLIDRLLASPEYADFFSQKWSSVLRNRRKTPNDDPKPTQAFHDWIRKSLEDNVAYDHFVREVLTAKGPEVDSPPVVWFREVKDSTTAMEDAAQLFLGQRLGCAKCHHHPFEKWSQHDYWSFAAFFSTIDVKESKPAKKNKDKTMVPAEPARVDLKNGKVEMMNPRTSKLVPAAGLGDAVAKIDAGEDPRGELVDWMTEADNPYFAKALANRYWKHFLGRGLIDPEDDMRATNPATNPELLDALAKHFIDSKYDLKKLIRSICTSKTYQLSAVPNEHNADDSQNYSRFLPKRLHAEVLLDAIDDVTGARTKFKNSPANVRAVQLPDNSADSYFLSVFGKPDAASACECERSGGASLAQALHMFNSQEMMAKVGGPRIVELVKDSRPHAAKLADLYLIALSRKPTDVELKALEAFITKKGDVKAAYEDICWALLNTKEFLFNH